MVCGYLRRLAAVITPLSLLITGMVCPIPASAGQGLLVVCLLVASTGLRCMASLHTEEKGQSENKYYNNAVLYMDQWLYKFMRDGCMDWIYCIQLKSEVYLTP